MRISHISSFFTKPRIVKFHLMQNCLKALVWSLLQDFYSHARITTCGSHSLRGPWEVNPVEEQHWTSSRARAFLSWRNAGSLLFQIPSHARNLLPTPQTGFRAELVFPATGGAPASGSQGQFLCGAALAWECSHWWVTRPPPVFALEDCGLCGGLSSFSHSSFKL